MSAHARLALCLLLAAPLFAGEPAVTELGLLPGDLASAPAANDQDQPAIAAGGPGYLVAWTDQRTDPSFFGTEQTGRDVYAARLDADGALLDATPIVVSDAFGLQETPRVAWNGRYWLVVWESQDPTQSFYSTAYRAARVAPDGAVLDDPPLVVHQYPTSSSGMMTVTANGSDWLVVVQGTSAGEGGLLGVRVADDGTVVDVPPVELVPPAGPLYFDLEVVSAGGESLLAWDLSGTRRAQRFAADLTPLGAEFTTPVRWTGSDGAGYFGVWIAGASLVGSRMTADGTLLDPAGVPIAPSAGVNPSSGVSVSWDGTRWWVSWDHTGDGVLAARVAADGTTLDPGGIALEPAFAEEQGEQASAAADGVLQVAWADRRAGGINPDDVRALQVSTNGVPGASAPVSLGAPSQVRPDLAPGGPGGLVVYRSEVSGGDRVLAQRLDPSGAALDAEPIEVVDGVDLGAPRAAWNGSLWLVVWSQDGDVVGRRVLPDGTVLDTTPNLLVPDGASPDVAALDDLFLVVATRPTISIEFFHPFFVRVDGATGQPLEAEPVVLGQYFARVPHVTTFGGRWLATWQRNVSHDDPAANVKAAFIEADGTTTGEFTVHFTGGQPDVATTGDTALFVWRTGTDNSSDPDLNGRRMALDGTFLDDPFAVVDVPDKQLYPSVIWTGSEFLAAWQDLRDAEAFYDERTDVWAARVAADGTVIDPLGFPVATADDPEARPSLARVGGASLAATSDFRVEAPFASYRVALRAVGAVSAWTDLGQGLAGTGGVPVLEATGELAAGTPTTVALSNALPGATSLLVLGTSALSVPFKGGTLVPSPTVVVAFGIDANGGVPLAFPWPSGVPSGTTTWWQHWIQDPGGPKGLAASNALAGTTP